MNIFNHYKNIITDIIVKISEGDIEPRILQNIVAESPKDAKFGDISTNAAMVTSKVFKKSPRDVAELIKGELEKDDSIIKVDIAGPGFLNITIGNEFWQKQIRQIIDEGDEYYRNNLGQGEKLNIEYVSVNPTGPMHIGHARNAVVGDVLANIMAVSGYDVTKEYYINDAGVQVDVLAQSAFLRYKEQLGRDIGEIPQGLYPGEYLIDIAKDFIAEFGDKFLNDDEFPLELKEFAIQENLKMIKHDLQDLGVHHDVFTSEKTLHSNNLLEKSIQNLKSKELVYHGVLEQPKGKQMDDWEEREQLLFKSTEFGDDVDRPLQKSDGAYTYFTADIAYHQDKISRGFNKMALILGADHGGYVKRIKAIVKALSDGEASIEILLAQLVKISENGEALKMSKRAGNFITLREVLDKVGKDILRFMILTRKSDAPLDFDLKKVVETSKENPVFYVQYANARINSVFKQALEERDIEIFDVVSARDSVDLSSLNNETELELIKKMAEFPKIIESSAIAYEPHRITFYLYDLASAFHKLWSVGAKQDIKFLCDDKNLTKARLLMIYSAQQIIKSGLKILAVDAVEKM